MLQPNKLRIYNASAGAGKTYTLVKEFLSLLFLKPEADAFKKLLAITFTNKAANEMKSRIVEKLQELSLAEDQDTELKGMMEETGLSANEVREKSQRILTVILHNYGLFAVSTIDKFNLRLMRAFSQDLGLSINFDVEMNTEDILTESVDMLFSELQDQKLLAETLSEIALENLSQDKAWDISQDMVSQTKNILNDKNLNFLQALQKLSIEDLNAFRKEVNRRYYSSKKAMDDAAKIVMDYTHQHGITLADFTYGNRGSVLKYFVDIQNGKYNYFGAQAQKYYDKGPASYLKNKSIDADAMHNLISNAYAEITQHIDDFLLYAKIKKEVNSITFINEVEKRLNTLKEENNILLIGDFNKIISENIKDQPTPFIYEKIGNRYHHYFIDEFQDTSDLQWSNFTPLVLNALSEAMTVMIVGDPKQSIYRFRGGNPNLMIGLMEMKGSDDRIQVSDLPTNWRSYDEVINFNNNLYTSISRFLEHPGYRELYEKATQKVNHKKGGFVQLRFQPSPPKGSGEKHLDHCMERMLEDIQQARENGFRWYEMAILTRGKAEGRSIAEFLAEHHINVISNESLLLKSSDHVMLVISFIQYLIKPNNAEFRADLILQLFHNQVIQGEDPTELLNAIIKLEEREFMEALKAKNIDLTFLQLPFQSFYDQVSAAIRAFGLQQESNAYISFFMDEVLKFQNQSDPTAQAFMTFWEQKSEKLSVVVPEGQEAIQLMTIHKSKGLQFPVVFMPYITWNPKTSGVWIPIEGEKFNDFYIKDLKDKDKMPDEVQAKITEEEQQSEMDELNALYVATTRAIEQLYMICEVPSTKEPKPVASYLYSFATSHNDFEDNCIRFGSPERVSTKQSEVSQNQTIVPFISSDWTQKVKVSEEHALLWDESRAEALAYGRKMHSVLEKIHHINETDDVLDNFELQGFITIEEKHKLSLELKYLFEHNELSDLFNAEEFYSERDFVSPSGDLFRPDRLVNLEGKWILMDYKTGEPKKSYERQLNNYAAYLDQLGMPVHKKLLIFLDQKELVVEVE